MTWAEAAIELSAILKQIDQEFLAKDAEIERLKTEALAEKNSHYRSLQLWGEKEDRLKVLITELCDALSMSGLREYAKGDLSTVDVDELLDRAREATR